MLTSCGKALKTAGKFLKTSRKVVKTEKPITTAGVKNQAVAMEKERDYYINLNVEDNSESEDSGW